MVLKNYLNLIHWLFVKLMIMENMLFVVVVNYILKSVWRILKKILLVFHLLKLIQLLHTKKQLPKNQIECVWVNHQINTIEFMLKLKLCKKNYVMKLKKRQYLLKMILKKEENIWQMNMVGKEIKQEVNYGVLVLRILELIY